MAIMIDQRPNFHGEGLLWDKLKEFLPTQNIVYNNREINGREFDVCILLGTLGILIIEVKGWRSNAITVKGIDHVIVEGYSSPQRSPKKQARAYRFALLNKIREKYNSSPLIFDMVCYPFISKDEYYTKRLDIISSEQQTIFEDDLETSEKLLSKIQAAYDIARNTPHSPLTEDLINKIRQSWEPSYMPESKTSHIASPGHYSELNIFPCPIESTTIQQISEGYFNGTKQIVFTSDLSSYQSLINTINLGLSKHNIQPMGNTLSVGFKQGLQSGSHSTMTFNLEIEFCPNLSSIFSEPLTIIEGELHGSQASLLRNLAEMSGFNFEQYQVEHASADHNILVEAGAGTGKTYSMVSRIAFLCNKKRQPVTNIAEEIGMVTFTNDAAANMKTRLKQMFTNYYVLTGNSKFLKFLEDTDRDHISTIHSFALNLLRKESLYTGLGTNFKITSNEYLRGQIYDSKFSIFLAQKEEEDSNFVNTIPVPIYDLKKKSIALADRLLAKSVNLDHITRKDMGVTVENSIPYFNDIIENVIIPSEHEFNSRLHETNNMDLKECLILLNDVLKQKASKSHALKLRYLFIDEFQDTDDIQIEIFQRIQKMIEIQCCLFVVGDLKQSIYRFRGAKLSAFNQLRKNCLYDWDCYHLNINYRTDGRLLDIFDEIFSSMGAQHYLPYSVQEDRLVSRISNEIAKEDLMKVIPCHGKDQEVFFDTFVNVLTSQRKILSNYMEKKRLEGKKLNETERTIAILVRSNWQVDKLVEAAKNKGLRIQTKTGGDLFQLPSTIDLYKLISALIHSSNPLSLVSFIESNYTNMRLDYHFFHGRAQKEILLELDRILDEFFFKHADMTWQQVKEKAYAEPVLSVLKQIYDSLQPWKNHSSSLQEQRHYMTNYEYLLERIIAYARADSLTLSQIAEYLRINIVTGQQQLSRNETTDDGEIRMICTTVHKSKGLEYGTVILPYTDEDIDNPRKIKTDASHMQTGLAYTLLFENKVRETNSNYDFSEEIDEQISEESRILYVALTRTIRNCVWIKNLDSQPKVSWSTLLEV